MSASLVLILAAEDEESDAFILRLAFEKAQVPNPLTIVKDGQEVVNYLTGAPPYGDRAAHPLPGLITLDLKMPRMNGFDVLTWLGGHAEFKDVPAVVISSSSDAADIAKARNLGACDYFVKPLRLVNFVELARTLQQRWLAPQDG
jgi:CheY-like chemotaxis protein